MKLRWRFTLTLALAALVPITVAAVVTRTVIAARARDEYRDRRTASYDAMKRAIDDHRDQVEQAVHSLTNREHPYVAKMLRDHITDALRKTLPELQNQARSWMDGLSLDVLTIVDDARPVKNVLVSAHLRAAEGDPDDLGVQQLHRDTGGVPYFAIVEVAFAPEVKRRPGERPTEKVLVALGAGVSVDGTYSLGVLAGRRIRPELLATVYNEGRVDTRIVRAGAPPREPPMIPPKGHDWAALTTDEPDRIELMGPDGKTPVAYVEIAVSRGDLDTVLETLTAVSFGLALVALGAVVLIGLFVARRTARDLDALVEGSLAAARGDLHHRVPVRSKDEVGAVTNAFNFMMEDLQMSKERLVIAERIAAWQDIARRLAHEIKNPLTPIQMAMDTLRKTHKIKHPSFDEILEESTTTVLQEADRLKKIVAEFSDFARMPKPNYQRIDLNEVVRSAVTLYKGSVDVDAKLSAVPQIDADKGQVSQVVLNLVENARDAIASRGADGKITVSTRLGDAGDRAVLVVEDNGPGVPSELKEKVFTPYFTTKHAKGGTGLGLAIVHRIVSDHGGRIAVGDAPGGGARFLIELPLRNGAALLVSRI